MAIAKNDRLSQRLNMKPEDTLFVGCLRSSHAQSFQIWAVSRELPARRPVITRHKAQAVFVPMPEAALDLDTTSDYESAVKRQAGGGFLMFGSHKITDDEVKRPQNTIACPAGV
jgi:hypothetical protein